MGKVIKQTDDGLPVFGNDDSDVLVVSNDENGLPVFSKKKAASNGGGNGLNQPSQSQSNSPAQSQSGGNNYVQRPFLNDNPEYTKYADSVLKQNADKNFVQRYLYPDKFPKLQTNKIQGADESGKPYSSQPDDEYSTHLMSYDPGSKRVYPEVVQLPNGQLKHLSGDEAWNYADKTGEYIQFKTADEAKKFADNGYKRGNQFIQSQSPQSGSVKTFDEPALKLSDGGVPVNNTPAQTAPSQNIDFNKLNAQHGIVAPTTEEKTVSAASEEKVQEKVGKRNEAIANTLSKKYGNNQNSPEYRKEFNDLKKKLNDGDVVLTHAQDGKPFVVRSQGFLESAGKSLIESFKAPIEGFKIQNMDGKELADYLDKKSAEQPYLEESAPSPFLGELGSAGGGFPKIAGEFGVNAAVPFLGTAIATADAELSAAGNKTAELYQKNLKELTDNGVPLEKARIEAADKAKKDAPLAAAPDALLTAALGEYGADTKGISDAAQTFKQTLIKSGESIGKFGVLGGAAGVSEAGIEKAQGYDISMKDALDKFGEEGFQYATMDAMFKILPVASKLPSAAYRAWKEYMTKIPAPQFLDEIDNQVKNGTISQDEADKAAANLGGYVKAKNKTIPTGNVEKDGLITELVQEKLKLEEDKKTLDPNFHKEKDKQIADIDSKINLVKYSKHPIEVDDITGEFNLNPKSHDELTAKEKEGIVVPKDYGGTEVEEVGGKGEDAETKYKPTAYFTEKKGSLELKQPIDVGDKTYSDKQKAQEAADKALKQHYYENGLHESGKPQKKQQDNGLQLQKEEETSKVTEPATAGAGGEAAPDKTKATIESAVIEINGKTYEGKNHAEAILKAKEAGEDISNVDRKAEGKFKLSDGTVIDRSEALKRFGADRAEQLIPQDENAKQADENYKKEQKPLSRDEVKSLHDNLTPEQKQEYLDAEIEGKGDEYLKSLNNGKTLPNAAAKEKPKEEPQAEVIQPKGVEGNQPSNEPQPSEESGVAETKPIEPTQEPTENKVENSDRKLTNDEITAVKNHFHNFERDNPEFNSLQNESNKYFRQKQKLESQRLDLIRRNSSPAVIDRKIEDVTNKMNDAHDKSMAIYKAEKEKFIQSLKQNKPTETKPIEAEQPTKLKEIEDKYTSDIHEANKADLKLDLVADEDLSKHEDARKLRKKQQDIVKRLSKLQELVKCK